MRRQRLLIGLLLLAIVCVDVAALAVRPGMGVPHPYRWDATHYPPKDVFDAAKLWDYFAVVVWGLYLLQVSVAAIWLALGLAAAPLRFIAVSGIILVWNAAISTLTQETGDFAFGMLISGVTAVVIAVPPLAARPLGLRLALWRDAQLREIAPSGTQRWQFSLLYLFGLMTALAVFLGMLKFMFIYDVVWAFLRQQLRVVATDPRCQLSIGLHAIVAWCALGIALGNRRWPRIWLGIAVIGAILGTCFGRSLYGTSSLYWQSQNQTGLFWWHWGWSNFWKFGGSVGPWSLSALFLLEAVLELALLWPFRLIGYRVVFRRARGARTGQPTDANEGGG
jgi:hypothetical protein